MKKKAPAAVVFRFFLEEILPSYMVIVINHEIRIPIKQLVEWKVKGFFRGSIKPPGGFGTTKLGGV